VIATRHDGPAHASATVVLAPGAGAGMEHPFLASVARGLAAADLAVVRLDFPYRTAGRRAPDRMPVLQQALRDVVRDHVRGPFVLAGKSMGGRVATMVADELGAHGVVVFGYPFHPPAQPQRLRTAHLAALRTRTLLLQGERDEFGTREEVEGYALSPAIELAWFADGDHSLVPRARSGFTAAAHLATAIGLAVAFVRAVGTAPTAPGAVTGS
jgi:predicted alpha/beta-hydrolase family hydrolase